MGCFVYSNAREHGHEVSRFVVEGMPAMMEGMMK
jgi:hypothetical protein